MAHVDKYADLAAAGRYRDQVTGWADEAAANAADPQAFNRQNFVYTTAESWTRRADTFNADVDQMDEHIDALRTQRREQ